MYITCEQCSTIYRLDETLLKASGSKVRCSQCHFIFVAEPPEAELVEVDQPVVIDESVDQYQDTFDQELAGIDVAELDSILEQGRTKDAGAALMSQMDGDEDDEPIEFSEADLDMDFEAAFDKEEDISAAADAIDAMAGSLDQELEAPLEDLSGEIDLDMDFELDDGDDVFAQSLISEDDDLDLDMEFDLDDTIEDSSDVEASDGDVIADDVPATDEDVMLNEDVELALDDFEDVLGGAVGTENQDLPDVVASEEEIELDVELDDGTPQELDGIDIEGELPVDDTAEAIPASPQTEGDDLDLAGLDALLEEEDDDASLDMSEPEDVELSLDDDIQLDLEEEPVSEEGLNESSDTIAEFSNGDVDDLDLAGLDDLLGVDEELDGVAVSKGEDLSLDEDLELSLDDGAVLDDVLDESETTALSGDTQDDDDLDLAGFDDLLDEDEEPAQAAVSEFEELSLDEDLELTLDEDAVLDDASSDESEIMALSDDTQDDDLDLAGLDDLLDEDEGPVETAVAEGDPLNLDEDFELSLDDAPVSEAAPSVDQNERDEFDLSDFEDLLTEDAAPEGEAHLELDDEITLVSEAETDTTADDIDDFDMSDFDNLLDEEPVAEEVPDDDIELKLDDDTELKLDDDIELELDDDTELALDDDLDLSLDDESGLELDSDALGQLVASEDDADDFDLSGLDNVLSDENVSETPKVPDEQMTLSLDDDDLDDDDIDLSLDEDFSDTTEAIGDDIGDLEDLEFELDAEFENKPIAQESELSEVEPQDEAPGGDQPDESLDLSDIEKMLEDDTIVPESSGTTQGLMMDSESGDDDKWEDDAGDDLGQDDDEIDLSEIEEALDSVDDDDQDAPFVDDDGIDQELELDLGPEEPKVTDASDEFEFQLEMDDSPSLETTGEDTEDSDALDLSDFDLSMEDEKPTVETETIDGGDIQLEFQIDEKGRELDDEDALAAARTTAEASTTSGFMQMKDEDDFSVEETIATEPIQEQPAAGIARAPKKKGTSKALLVLILLLVLLVAGGYFGYDYVVKNNIQIPYLSDYLNPEAKDPSGVQQLATLEINSKFIENEADGRLFVITGKIRNGYSISRKMIRLRGKLYTKGKVLAKTEHSFAGLVMADQELSSKPMAEIKKGLSSTIGQDAAITVVAGNSAPFMVVFSELPADLDEFVIELVSSIKAQ